MTQTIRQHRGIRRYRDLAPPARLRLCDVPHPIVLLPTPTATRADRIAEKAWKLHDGMAWLWTLMGAVVLVASMAIAAALLVSAIGPHR